MARRSYKDTRKNLRAGRGRVRRIAVRTAEGRQINLLAVSAHPAPRLIEIMRGRWGQETPSSTAPSAGGSISSTVV